MKKEELVISGTQTWTRKCDGWSPTSIGGSGWRLVGGGLMYGGFLVAKPEIEGGAGRGVDKTVLMRTVLCFWCGCFDSGCIVLLLTSLDCILSIRRQKISHVAFLPVWN